MMISQKQDVTHKKRFGQYFSGKTVAEMLFSLLPQNREWRTVIDPMAGIGDMLVAVSELSKGTPKIVGIEIDDIVAKHCQDRNPKFEVHCEDAFKSKSLWSSEGWDLVITNPPYVRYQLLGDDESVMPSAQEIRTNLLQQIECAEHINYILPAFKNPLISLHHATF